jgi:preprotein translocase subunit YajC
VGSQAGQQLLFLAVVVLGFLLLVIRPQRARARALREVRASLAVGTPVMTTAGLYATVTEVQDEVVVLEIAPGVRARFATGAVVRVVEPRAAEGPGAPPAP